MSRGIARGGASRHPRILVGDVQLDPAANSGSGQVDRLPAGGTRRALASRLSISFSCAPWYPTDIGAAGPLNGELHASLGRQGRLGRQPIGGDCGRIDGPATG